jgi:hypothetical protein
MRSQLVLGKGRLAGRPKDSNKDTQIQSADTQFVPDGTSTASKGAAYLSVALYVSDCCKRASDAPSLELENEPRLVAEIVLIVVPAGEVVNEARQKIIGFDRPDRQVRSDFNIDATPKHHIQGPIAR